MLHRVVCLHLDDGDRRFLPNVGTKAHDVIHHHRHALSLNILLVQCALQIIQHAGTVFDRQLTELPSTEWHNKRELLKTPTKIEETQEKKFIDRNWTITTCLFRDSNPHYQCLKITSCRWRPPPLTHSFTATTHFKSSRSFVSFCVCCMLCRMRQSRILQSMQHTHRMTQKNGNFWNA